MLQTRVSRLSQECGVGVQHRHAITVGSHNPIPPFRVRRRHRPDSTIPFMAMPDAIEAMLTLASAPAGALTRTAYNVSAFSRSAADIRDVVVKAFPNAAITYAIDDFHG